MELSQEHKLKVEQRIMETIMNALDKDEITTDDYNAMSEFILGKIEGIKTHHDLVIFLREISEKWKIFTFVLTLENGEVKKIEENKAVEKVEQLTQVGDVNQALEEARKAISNSQQ